MRHAGTQEIETPRLLLRRLMPSDAPMMYANWANDPEVTRWLRWTPHKDVAETQELLSAWAMLYPNEDYYQWAIVEKATGQVFAPSASTTACWENRHSEMNGRVLTSPRASGSRATASAEHGGAKAAPPRL